MTTISPAGNPHRISLGKRATRTVTAPSLSGRQHSIESKTHRLTNRYASQDNGLWPFSNSGYLSPRLKTSSSTCLRDVKEVFTIQQIMRDTLETRLKPRSGDARAIQQKNHHKKEFLRTWSRERIIVTEEIIYPTTNLSVTSASGSFSSIIGPQSKPYFPLERYNTISSGKSLPVTSVTMVGALPSHVAEYGRKVPLSTTGVGRMTLSRDRRTNLQRQSSEPEGATLLFSDLSSVGMAPGAKVIEVKKGSQSLRFPQQMSSQTPMQLSDSGSHRRIGIQAYRSAETYNLMEHADEDQLVQNIPSLRPIEAVKSRESVSEENLRRNAVLLRVPIIEYSSASSSSKISSNPPLQASVQRTNTLTPQDRQQSPLQMLSASEFPPSSSPPDYQSVISDERDLTARDEEDLHSTSTSVYVTARSSISPSPSQEEIIAPASQTPTLQAAPPQYFFQHGTHEFDTGGMTTVIDKLDAATETLIPTSPVYFRTIVRRDHAGYGLTVCGTNPVTPVPKPALLSVSHPAIVRGRRGLATSFDGPVSPLFDWLKTLDIAKVTPVNGVNVEEMDHQEVVERIRAKATVCFMLRRMRPSRSYLAAADGERTETASQPSHRRYQKRRLHREAIGLTSAGGTAAAVSRRRPNNGVGGGPHRGYSRDLSSSPPSYSGRTDTDGDETIRGSGGGHGAYGSSSGSNDWPDEDASKEVLYGSIKPSEPRTYIFSDIELSSVKRRDRRATANLPSSADGGSFADLPPLHPTSATSTTSLSKGSFNSATIGGTSAPVTSQLSRSRGSMGAADRPHSSSVSSGSKGHRRPLSLAEGTLISPIPSGSSTCTASTPGSIFRTLPASNKIKQKANLIAPQSAQQNASPIPPPPPGHFLGRALDEDDSDDEQIREEICNLAAKFQSASSVLSSPSLSAVFINYLLVQNHELAPTLFYLVAKHYHWMQTHSKELAKDFLRVLMEIYTTFLHERAPLHVQLDTRVIQQMEDSVSTRDSATILDGCSVAVLPQIQALVDKLSKDIRHGLDTWKPPESFDLMATRSREEELSIYETIIGPRVGELQRIISGLNPVQLPASHSSSSASSTSFTTATSAIIGWLSATEAATETPREHLALALCASLVSAYRYFAASISNTASTTTSSGSPPQLDIPTEDIPLGSAPTCPNTPAPTQHSFRKSLFAKSIENLSAASSQTTGGAGLGSSNLSGSISANLASAGVTNWDKLASFNAKLKSKSSNALFGSWKSKIIEAAFTQHSQKGHSLQERIFDRVAECTVCGGLIWGLAPQGLTCQACDVCVHHRCKSGLKETCTKEGKSSSAGRGSVTNVSMNTSSGNPPGATSFSVPRSSSIINSPASISQYPYPPEPANSSAGNFTSPLEDAASSGGGRGDSSSSGLAASTEDLSNCRNSGFSELAGESSSASPLQNPSFSLAETPVALIVDEEAKVKRSNSGFSRSYHRGSSQIGLTSPEPISRYVRNKKQKLDNHSYSITASALSKHTTSLMQLPIMSDRELKRASAASQVVPPSPSSSAAANVPELLPTWSGDPEMDVSESFEAANELRIHFPNYEIQTKGPRVQDHVRTLVLLEFHQKVRYMVCHLKQFDYLLLQRWPKEHQQLADLMALDRIPRLIRLFRSLVRAIEKTMEPQGYGKMAEAVLQWLSMDDEANLKAWVRDCQALSCTNMLDCVKATVREYARKHPDIQPVLETRFNKFVLIEGLSQFRILYFNLPLISNNIMKDLEKKTSSYKAEAKIWKEIHSKLASIPHSIDKICMPLVKLINEGHFFSTVDKGEQLTRHQAQGGNLPFADLMLQFPRTLFRYWVIDYAEIAIDKLTFTSDNKVNYDFVKERTEVLAILLDSSLVLLVKDGGRYGLRPFKPSKEPGIESMVVSTTSLSSTQPPVAPNLLGNTMKLSPVFSTHSVFTSLGEQIGSEYMLNMIFKEQAILLRLSFSSKETREKWLRILKKREEKSDQRRLAAQKSRASLPPASTHSANDLKVDAESFKTNRASTPVVQTNSGLSESPQMQESELLLDVSSHETIEEQITHFTGKISEMEQGLQELVRTISTSANIDVNKILENLSLKSGETVPQSDRELMVAELVMTENWLKFVKRHLHQLSHGHKEICEKKVELTATQITSTSADTIEKGHHRSKSAIVITPVELTDRRRRSRTGSGPLHNDRIEMELAKSFPVKGKEGDLVTEEDLKNEESTNHGRNQLVEMIHDLQKLAEKTSLVASRALRILEPKEKEVAVMPEDSKSDEEQRESYLDATSSLSFSSTSSSESSSGETEEPKTSDYKNVGEPTSLEETVASDREAEEMGEDIGEYTESQEILEMDDYVETPLREPVSKLDEDLVVPETPLAKEEDGREDEDCECNDVYEDQLRLLALQLVDDVIDAAGAYEMDIAVIAKDLTDSAINSAINQMAVDGGSRRRSPEFACTTDSGISFIEIPGQLSSGEDDELTVTGSKPHLAPTPTETGGGDSVTLFSDLDKIDIDRPPSPSGVSVGRNDSQKSTTSSGYLGSGDEIVQQDWI
ncbi:hypothetical protein Aperf_G00000075578 [Anoplocephala perfoliata]